MAIVRKHSVNIPLSQPLLAKIVDVLLKASAMGLIEKPKSIFALDFSMVQNCLKRIAKAGFGRSALSDVDEWNGYHPDQIMNKLNTLANILEESPSSKTEWTIVRKYIADDLLRRLIGDLSPSSINRYSSGERITPDEVGRRLHTLALIIGDLSGSYNDEGIRQWFTRPRKVAFDGRTPFDLLQGAWEPYEPGPEKVRKFAASLNESVAS